MAITKEKELATGVVGNYWVAQPIADAVNKKTKVLMYLFKDADARATGHIQLHREDVGTMNVLYPTGEEVYAFVKESNMSDGAPAVAEVLDEEGNVVTPAVAEVPQELNWFADAEDC